MSPFWSCSAAPPLVLVLRGVPLSHGQLTLRLDSTIWGWNLVSETACPFGDGTT